MISARRCGGGLGNRRRCGACRVEVGGKTRFVCVDGPEFDGHEVDWDLLLSRQRIYLDEEKQSLQHFEEECRCRAAEQMALGGSHG